jgi:CBS domain-containing protein
MNKDMLTITPDTQLDTAAEFFIENKYGCLPVVDGGRLVGLITPIDFVKLAHRLITAASA